MLGGERVGRNDLIRFLAEAEAVAAIKHENVVQVFDYGDADGRPFMALEFLPGGSLSGSLAKGRESVSSTASACDTAALLSQVARGVAAAHALGIVHRDLKPANVLLDEAGAPKVADFGLAKRGEGSEVTQTGQVMGTPAYMSPEQAKGETKFVGPQADVWALGVMFYEALTGRRPFQGTVQEILAKAQTADPVPPRKSVPTIPRDLELICLKCLAKQPHERYPTAKELADDLDRFARGEPIRVRPAGLLERGYKWAKRKPAVAGLYAATTTAVLLLFVGAAIAVERRAAVAARIAADTARDEADRERGNADAARGVADREREKAVAARDGEIAARNEVTTLNYYRQVERAHGVWGENDVLKAMRLLIDTTPDRRDWEWRYVARLCRSEIRLIRARAPVPGVSISPDGRTWVGALEDGTAPVWDAATGKELLVYRGHKSLLKRALFHPDGVRVLSTSHDGEVHIWEAGTGKPLHTFKLPGEGSFAFALNGDGSRVAAGTYSGPIRIWNLETKEEIATLTGHNGSVIGVLFAPDGRLFSVGGDGTLRSWDIASKKQLTPPRGHRGLVWGLTLTPDKQRLLTSDESGRIYTWDATTLNPVSQFVAHDNRVWSIVFSPDGSQVLTTSLDQTAKLWDAKTWRLLRTFRGHTNDAVGGAFLADGRVMTHGGDRTVRAWDATRDAEARVLAGGGVLEGVAFDPSGRLVAGGAGNGIPVWEAGTGKLVGRFGAPGETGRGVAFTPDGAAVVSGGLSGKVRAWPLDGGPPRILGEHNAPVTAVAFVPGSGRVASIGRDGLVKVWGTDPNKPVWSAPHAGPLALAVSPDGRILATGGEDKHIRLWDANTGHPIRVLTGHTFRVSRVAFSPDGKRLASGSHDNTVRVWHTDTGKEEVNIKGHVHYIDGVAFSPDGNRVVDASGDKMVRLYDSRTGQETLTLKGHGNWVTGAAFSPDGARIATSARDGTVRIWDAPHGIEVVLPPEADESHSEK